MKRILRVMFAATALMTMTGRAEAAPIYVGDIFYCDSCGTGPYVDVLNVSDPYGGPGVIDDLVLTVKTAGTTDQYAFGRLDADPDDLNFFLVGTANFASVARGLFENATFRFDAFGILPDDFLSASLSFTFDGLPGDQPVIVTSEEPYAQLTATPAPEPGTFLLLASGIAAMAARRRRIYSAGK